MIKLVSNRVLESPDRVGDYVLGKTGYASVNSSQWDFVDIDIPDDWEQIIGLCKPLSNELINGFHVVSGQTTLRYTKHKDVKELLGVTIDYRMEVQALKRNFTQETFSFSPYGGRWGRRGLVFPQINDIINPADPDDKRTPLSSQTIRDRIQTALSVIAHSIENAE